MGSRSAAVFSAADRAYPRVGLVQHPGKRQRGVRDAVVLGAELRGEVGDVGAPRLRVVAVASLTLRLVRACRCSRALLASVVGLWVHILLFRRPVLCVLGAVFRFGRGASSDTAVLDLPPDVVDELLALVALAPTAYTNLRAVVVDELWASDASPFGGGLVRAALPPGVGRELWRLSEQRGGYTRLASPLSAFLAEFVEPDVPEDDVDLALRHPRTALGAVPAEPLFAKDPLGLGGVLSGFAAPGRAAAPTERRDFRLRVVALRRH